LSLLVEYFTLLHTGYFSEKVSSPSATNRVSCALAKCRLLFFPSEARGRILFILFYTADGIAVRVGSSVCPSVTKTYCNDYM